MSNIKIRDLAIASSTEIKPGNFLVCALDENSGLPKSTRKITLEQAISGGFKSSAVNIPSSSLPIATTNDLGAIKVGANLDINAQGVLSVNSTSVNAGLPIATTNDLGVIKVGSNLDINAQGVLSVNSASVNAGLPIATTNDLGVIKVGSNLDINVQGVLSVDSSAVNATHTGDVTGSTALTISANAVESTMIDSTDTVFNVNDSNSNIGTGALANPSFQLTVDGGSGKDTIYAKGNQSGGYVDLKLENENASGNGARFRAVKGDFTATLQVQPTYKRASVVIEDDSGSSKESVGVYVTNETGLSQGSFIPLGSMLNGTNSNINLGGASLTWDNGYINGGAWTGSDRNLKQDIEDLSEAELRVATTLKGLMKKFRLKDAVVKKGDDARIHVGVIAQDVKSAFEAEGLDSYRYAILGEDTWWSKQDENGEWLFEKTETEGFTKHTKMSVRYEQLLAFIVAAL
jgi:hypothetical protein